MQFLNVKISIRGCELQKKKTQENPENKKKKRQAPPPYTLTNPRFVTDKLEDE